MTTNWSGQGTTNIQQGSQQTVTADVIRYVNKLPERSGGWLTMRNAEVKDTKSGMFKEEAIFKYAKLTQLGSKSGKTFFKVMEGPNKGKTVYLSDANVPLYIGTKAPEQKGIDVTVTYGKYDPKWVSVARGDQVLKQQLATLSVAGISAQVAMNSVWKEDAPSWKGFYPIEPGTYKILLPNAPHDKNMTTSYRKALPSLVNDQVWFPMEFGDNSRFVHVGNVSDGCTTVLDLGKWDLIHEVLISHRAADGVSVGRLIVKGKRERIE